MVEQNLIPELRFPEFVDLWKEIKLGEVFTNSRKKGNNTLPIYSVSQSLGLVPRESLDRSIQKDASSDSNLAVDKGDLVYNMMRMWQGAIGIAMTNCMVSPAYVVLKPKKGELSQFHLLMFSKPRSLYLFWAYSYGLTNDRLRLYFKDFATIKRIIPSPAEQQKIASFLTAVDKRIKLLEEKQQQLERYKQGVMQKVFSQEIRFKDEEGNDFPDWEEKRLGDILDYEQPTKYLVSDTEYRDDYETPVLTAGKTFILGYTNETNGIFNENLPTIIFDDFTTAFQFVNFPFKAKSSAMKMLIPKISNVSMTYVFEVMKTIQFPLSEHKRYWISEYQNELIPYPSVDEQTKIVSFINSLNLNLFSIQKQIDGSIKFKKGLLQKMFV